MIRSKDDLMSNIESMANLLQVASFALNIIQTSNDEIMKGLEHQNDVYFEKIVAQNEKIISLLEKGKI